MGPDALARIRELFARERAVLIPITRLHELLAAEADERAPGIVELESFVRRRSDAFLVLEPATQSLTGVCAQLPAAEREPYARALAELPIRGPRVACITEEAGEPLEGCAGALRATMVQLCRLGAADARLRDALAQAVTEADAVAAALCS